VAVCPIIYDFGKGTPHHRLSNFYWPCPVTVTFTLPGPRTVTETYPASEHAYQAFKTLDDGERRAFQDPGLTPGRAKRMGRAVTLRPDWLIIQVPTMLDIVRAKFGAPEMRQFLLGTAPLMLMEGNYWHDMFWGVCFCKEHQGGGLNKLGKVLMAARHEFQAAPPETH